MEDKTRTGRYFVLIAAFVFLVASFVQIYSDKSVSLSWLISIATYAILMGIYEILAALKNK